MKTKELIQELVGLCVDKNLSYQYVSNWKMLFVYNIEIDLELENANQQLQNAIEKVREL